MNIQNLQNIVQNLNDLTPDDLVERNIQKDQDQIYQEDSMKHLSIEEPISPKSKW